MFRRRSEHDRVEELLSSYIDGELSIDKAALVERHLRGCTICAANLATLRQTVDLMQRLPQVKPPRSFTLSSLPVEGPPRRVWGYVYLKGATALAAMLLFAFLATDLGLRHLYTSVMPAAAPAEFEMAIACPTSQPLAAVGAPQATPYAEGATEEALRAVGEGGMDVEMNKEGNVPTPGGTPTSVPEVVYGMQASPMVSPSPTITPTLELTPSLEPTNTATLEPTPTPAPPSEVVEGPPTPSSVPHLNWLRALEIGAFLLFVVLAGFTVSMARRRIV